MTTEHTSGPWGQSATLSSDMHHIRYISGPTGEKIATVDHPVDMGQATALANAHLIAAAPDLLAALKECRNCLTSGRDDEEDKRARAAIKKAEG